MQQQLVNDQHRYLGVGYGLGLCLGERFRVGINRRDP
jgi:hypothetical protein